MIQLIQCVDIVKVQSYPLVGTAELCLGERETARSLSLKSTRRKRCMDASISSCPRPFPSEDASDFLHW